tara:strand:- start:32 stop:391 length:360 start_codon:yes stop_codon:yes gene_type:complete
MKLPIFIEDSAIPVLLSRVSPIDIGAITLGPFVFSRGKIDPVMRNHEAIHWQQYKETGIIGFILLYALFYIIGCIRYRSTSLAYYNIPFEREAYQNDSDFGYIFRRKRWAWLRYRGKYE